LILKKTPFNTAKKAREDKELKEVRLNPEQIDENERLADGDRDRFADQLRSAIGSDLTAMREMAKRRERFIQMRASLVPKMRDNTVGELSGRELRKLMAAIDRFARTIEPLAEKVQKAPGWVG
jgi:hypothetical protein